MSGPQAIIALGASFKISDAVISYLWAEPPPRVWDLQTWHILNTSPALARTSIPWCRRSPSFLIPFVRRRG